MSLLNGYIFTPEGITISEVQTTSGTCVNVEPEINITERGYLTSYYVIHELSTQWNKTDGRFRLVFYSKGEKDIIRYTAPVQGWPYEYYRNFIFAIRLHEVVSLDLYQYPCFSEKEVNSCTLGCLEEAIVNSVKDGPNSREPCSLPYMSYEGLRPCKTDDEFFYMYNATSHFVNEVNWPGCNCGRKCHEILYQLEFLSERLERHQDFSVFLTLTENRVIVVTEENTFTFSALFSDVGGIYGLFLGSCLLQCVEIIYIIIACLGRWRKSTVIHQER